MSGRPHSKSSDFHLLAFALACVLMGVVLVSGALLLEPMRLGLALLSWYALVLAGQLRGRRP